jgi:hypothetical protein
VNKGFRIVVGGLVALAVLAAPVAAGPDRTFNVSISPPSAVGGVATTFDVTITNTTNGQNLGSADLTAPAGFTVTGATLLGPGTILAPVGPSAVRLRDLALDTGASRTVRVTATAACPAGSHPWTIVAKQSPDFDGNKLFTTTDTLATTISSPCRLAFGNQPADVETGVVLTSARLDPAGPPLTVRALDGAGALMAGATGNVTAALSPSPGALGGTKSRPLTGGTATFSDLTVGVTGRTFAVTASAPSFVSATSTSFGVFNEGVLCQGSRCDGGASVSRTSTTVAATGLGSGTTSLGILLLADTLFPASVCGLFSPLGHGVFVDIRPLPGLTETTIRIDKNLVKLKPQPNGPPHFDLCVGTNLPFTTKSGGTSFFDGARYWGLVPDCPRDTITSPCMVSRNKNAAGDVILVGAVPEPYDPDFWPG